MINLQKSEMGLQGDSLNPVGVTAIYASTLVVLSFTSGALEQCLCDVCVEACKNVLLAFSSVSHYHSHCGGRYIMCVCSEYSRCACACMCA